MDTAVAIRTLEATYKSSADAAAVETMILKLTDKVYLFRIYYFLGKPRIAYVTRELLLVGTPIF